MSTPKKGIKNKAVAVVEKKPTTPHVYGKMLSKYGLTKKQEAFVCEFIANGGNATKAAMSVYDVNGTVTAQSVASENLSKPLIREAIKSILFTQVATPDAVASKMVQLMHDAKSQDTQLRAADSLSRVLGMATRERPNGNGGTTINFSIMSPSMADNNSIDAFATLVPDNEDNA